MSSKVSFLHRQKGIAEFIGSLLLESTQSHFFHYVIFFVSNVQFLAILLQGQFALISAEDADTLTTFTSKFTEIFVLDSIANTTEKVGYSILLIIIWIYFILLIKVIAITITCHIRALPFSKLCNKITYKCLEIHFSIVFWVANMVLMTTFSPNKGKEYLFGNLVTNHTALEVINIIFIIINYIIGLFGAWICFVPFKGHLFSTHDSSLQMLNFLFKGVMAVLFMACNIESLAVQVIYIAVACIICASKFYILYKEFPYYNHFLMKIVTIFCAIEGCIVLNNIPAIAFGQTDKGSVVIALYIDIVLFPVGIKLALTCLNKVITHYLVVDYNQFKSENDVFRKLYAFDLCVSQVNMGVQGFNNISETYFIGKVLYHAETCIEPSCPCKDFITKPNKEKVISDKDKKKSFDSYLYMNKYRILSDCIKNIKDSDHLKISLAHLIFEYQSQGISSALSFLFSTSNDLNTLLSVKKYILTLNIQKKISVYFMERHNGVLNLKEFVDYSLVKSSFTQSLISNTDKYLEFWELYNDIDIKVIDLLKSSIKMEKEADEIAQVWKTYSESTEAFYHRMKDPYSAYLSLVRNSPATSENIIRKFAWRHPPKRPEAISESLLLPEDLTQNNTISVYVSMAKDKVGKILHISNNITDLIGYTPEDLIDKPVDYLMPPSYAEKHREILIQHLEKSKTSESRDYAMVVGLVRTKKGHVLPATTYVSIFPYVQKELVYIAIIKVLNYHYEQILFDSKGYVDGFSETIGKNLNLTIGKKYHIKDLTSDLNDISTLVPQHNPGGGAYSYGARKQADENVKTRRNSVDANKSPPKRQMTYYVSKQRNSMYKSLATACEQNYDGFTRSATFTRQADAGARSDSNEPFQKYHIAIVQVPLLDVKLHIVVIELQVNRNVQKMISQVTPDAQSQKMLSLPKDSVVTFDDLENSAADLALPVTDALQQEKKFMFIERILSDDQQQEQQVKKFELNPKNNSLEADTQLPSSMKMERKESTLMTFEQRKMIAKNETHNTNNNESSNEVVEKNLRKQKDDDLPSDKAFSTATSGNLNPKFEQAAYSIPKSQGFQLVQLSGLGLLALCIIFHVVFAVCAGNYLNLIKGNTEVLSSSGIRLFQLTEMHKRTKIAAMVNDMYFSNYRYISLGITDAKALAISAIGDIQNSLKNMNNLIRSSLYKIESSLEIQFFSGDIPVYQGGKVTRYSNGFDLIDDLVAVGKKLSRTPAASILEGDHNLEFILTNTLNEIFVDCEDVNGIIVSDSEYKFDSMKKMDLAFILVIVALGICVFFLYFREEREMKVSRNKLIEIFLRINSAEIQQSLIDVRRLRNLLATDISEQKLPNLKRNLMIIKAKQKKELTTGSNSKFRKKNAITRDINHHIVIARFLVFLFPVCCLVPFIYSNISISNQSDTLMIKIDSMVKFNQNFYELGLVSASLYDYITSNGTSYLRTRPIDDEWEATFSSLTRAQTFLSNLPSDNSGDDGNSTTPPLSQIISGDLCTAVPLKGIPTSFCYGFGSGVLKQGILGVNSFIFMAFRAVKDQFDSSARQFADGQTALALTVLINAELISSVWQNNAYLLLGQELQTILEDEIDKTIDHTMIGLAIYIIFSLIFGPLLLYYIWKLVDKERVEWKKILRKVPFNVLITNTPLKNYLIKESGYMFGSSI